LGWPSCAGWPSCCSTPCSCSRARPRQRVPPWPATHCRSQPATRHPRRSQAQPKPAQSHRIADRGR
jgi:hypothetical protein